MSATSRFNNLPTCPACEAARPLEAGGLCATCTRDKLAGRLQYVPVPVTEATTTRRTPEPTEMSETSIPTFAPLYKRTSRGEITMWSVRVTDNQDGTATITTSTGLQHGKIQDRPEIIRVGKNAGRKNATTPLTQAINEAASAWAEARDRNLYGLTIEESDQKKRFAPMLAQSWLVKGKITSYAEAVDWADTDNLFVQPKFDGHRCLVICQAGKIQMFTKKGVEITTCDHLVSQLQQILPADAILDGELYIHGVPVTTIGSYIKRKQPGTLRLCLLTYDVNMTARFAERIATVATWLANNANHTQLFLARTLRVQTPDQMMAFQADCLANGYEGAMLRHGTEGYDAGNRSSQILKVKTFQDDEFVVVGCTHGRGDYESAAVFKCVTADGHTFDCTAPGDLPKKAWYLQNHQQFIGKRLVVKFQKFTETEHPVPFQPVAKCFEEDKE